MCAFPTPSMNPCELSIVIPFRNEEANVQNVIKELTDALDQEPAAYELLAVDNASEDRTGALIKELAAKHPHVKYVFAPEKGYGNAVRAGLRTAQGTYIGYGWGDGQMRAAHVVDVWRTIRATNADLVKVKRTHKIEGIYRTLLSFGFNLSFRTLFPKLGFDLLGDIDGCPKVLQRTAYQKLDITTPYWFIDAEIMIKAAHHNYRMVEVPVRFEKRKGGKSNMRINVIKEFMREAWKYKKEGY